MIYYIIYTICLYFPYVILNEQGDGVEWVVRNVLRYLLWKPFLNKSTVVCISYNLTSKHPNYPFNQWTSEVLLGGSRLAVPSCFQSLRQAKLNHCWSELRISYADMRVVTIILFPKESNSSFHALSIFVCIVHLLWKFTRKCTINQKIPFKQGTGGFETVGNPALVAASRGLKQFKSSFRCLFTLCLSSISPPLLNTVIRIVSVHLEAPILSAPSFSPLCPRFKSEDVEAFPTSLHWARSSVPGANLKGSSPDFTRLTFSVESCGWAVLVPDTVSLHDVG